jgi:exopolysaccharide biosynthesis WecB/TagA/CpsF family protein
MLKFKKQIFLITKFNKINFHKNFIFSALNLAFFSFYYNNKINIMKNYFLWCDGIIGSLLLKVQKTPGRKFIRYFYKHNFSKILIVGNYTHKQIIFLKNKFKTNVQGFKIPKISYCELKNYIPNIKKNNLVLITLPTPKQEILAYEISKKFKHYKIICIGGGLSIAAGEIKESPAFLNNLGLEFLWRLRTDPLRRINRLLSTGIMFIFYFLTGKIKKLKITKI